MRIRVCPKCGGRNINGVAGGEIGLSECSNCKFRGVIFPEIEMSDEDIRKELEGGSLEK